MNRKLMWLDILYGVAFLSVLGAAMVWVEVLR